MRPLRLSFSSSLFALTLAAPSAALANVEYPPPRPPEHFGRRGQIVVDELVGVHSTNIHPALGAFGPAPTPFSGAFMAYTSSSERYGTKLNSSGLVFRPSVDYFVTDQLSIGGSLTAHFARSTSTIAGHSPDALGGVGETRAYYRDFGLAVEPRVGVVVRLAESLSLWPRVGVGFHARGIGPGGAYEREGTFTTFSRVGLVASLSRFAYLDVGPEARLNLLVLRELGLPNKATSAAVGVSGALGLMFLPASGTAPGGRPRCQGGSRGAAFST